MIYGLLAVIAVLLALVLGFRWAVIRNRAEFELHPSQMSGTARALTQPLRAAADTFEKTLSNLEPSQRDVVKSSVGTSVEQLVEETSRMATLRDRYLEIASRSQTPESERVKAREAAARIEEQATQAAQIVDQLTLQIAARQSAEPMTVREESDISGLIANLENLGKAYAEMNQSSELQQSQ